MKNGFLQTGQQSSRVLRNHDQRRSSKEDIFWGEISLQIPRTGLLVILKQMRKFPDQTYKRLSP